MSKEKPLVEALSIVFVEEDHRLNKDRLSWNSLPPFEQARVMSNMQAVLHHLNAWQKEGLIILRDKPRTKRPPVSPDIKISSTGLGAPALTDGIVDIAKTKGFTGIPCGQCGGPNTVRIGKCLQCHDCHHNGECG